jgi:hypothetical protein
LEMTRKGVGKAPYAVLSDPLDLETYRQKRGISLETVADTTKISMRFLRAIDAREYEKLPGGIYDTNYVRQYAAAIEFDEPMLLADYAAAMTPLVPDVPEERPKYCRGLLDRWFGVPAPQGP